MDTSKSEEVVKRLRTALWPTAIYEFEYPAEGPAVSCGDEINLCVVVPDDGESTYHKSLRAQSSVRDLGVRGNFLVRHESEFRKRSRWLDSLERRIAQAGTLLYGETPEGWFRGVRVPAAEAVGAGAGWAKTA